MRTFALLPCDAEGRPVGRLEPLSDALAQACRQSAELYQRIGYAPPWVSYVAVVDGRGVGGGAFVGAPRAGMVEIAYFTLPEEGGRGYATLTASELVAIARRAAPDITLKAFTLQQPNASTRILERLGFKIVGLAQDAAAGEVWEWRNLPGP
jgi:[ribosomal protein S5]-alanine N-acetyltransferase